MGLFLGKGCIMTSHRYTCTFLIAVFILAGAILPADAAVRLPSVFGDHMVIQQGKPVPVWGWADPGEPVTVSFHGVQKDTRAAADGRWEVELPPVAAGGPFDMIINGKHSPITLSDVLVGEVWVCSGQSNMQWTVERSNNAEQEIASAFHPRIRLFSVERTVADTPQDDCNGSWEVCCPGTIPGFSAVGYFFGRELHASLDVPVGLIQTAWGGTPAESWTTLPTLECFAPIINKWTKLLAEYPHAKAVHDEKMKAWEKEAAAAEKEGKPKPRRPWGPMGFDHPHRPASLYNAMIAPLVPYAIQGAIWYQGESNAGRAYQYRELFPAMIEDWRAAWNQGDFPFLFVQLANFLERKPEPGESAWAELREAQLMTLDLRNTGMAVIIDIGEAKDIHPRNKQDVGKRLALIALNRTYGRHVAFSGPLYHAMRIRDGKIILLFKHANGGLVAKNGERLRGFAIAGLDREFVWADAVIQGDKVVVWSDKVPEPVAVRYAWADNPECNLYNGAGLPASPFRTDTWPGLTACKR